MSTKSELIAQCKELGIRRYTGKTKEELIDMISSKDAKPQDAKPQDAKPQDAKPIPIRRKKDPSKPIKLVDFFAGTGAFSLAFDETGQVETVFANDMAKESKVIYDENFSHNLTQDDIHNLVSANLPDCDVITAGIPCQSFSIAGYRKGFEDTRSNTFWKVCEIIDAKSPKVVILENVKNLVSHDDGKTFETIKVNLERRGYTLVYKVLNTAEITAVPQHRERIYVVGFKSSELAKKFSLDFPRYGGLAEKPCVSTCFEDREISAKYYYTDKSSTWDLVSAEVTKPNTIYQYRRVYVRENKSQECPTLTANMGGGGHNVPLIRDTRGIRKLTPRECFNFQGFPASYKLPALADSHLYKLAGNAVSVPVVRLIANRIVPLLLEGNTT